MSSEAEHVTTPSCMTSPTVAWWRSGMDSMGRLSRVRTARTSGGSRGAVRGFHGSHSRAEQRRGIRCCAMQVLAVNAGSSSLKLRLLGAGDELLTAVELAAPAGRADPEQLREALDGMQDADAIAHR